MAAKPFATVRVEAKGKPNHYEALREAEVARLLALEDLSIEGCVCCQECGLGRLRGWCGTI